MGIPEGLLKVASAGLIAGTRAIRSSIIRVETSAVVMAHLKDTDIAGLAFVDDSIEVAFARETACRAAAYGEVLDCDALERVLEVFAPAWRALLVDNSFGRMIGRADACLGFPSHHRRVPWLSRRRGTQLLPGRGRPQRR